MFTSKAQPARRNLFRARRWLLVAVFAALSAIAFKPAYTQGGFVSGSTGADGALNPTTSMIIPVDKPVYNHTRVNIPAGVTITYRRNPNINYPVVILATQDVTIEGDIVLEVLRGGNAEGGAPDLGGKGGPGGFDGGRGGASFDNRNGAAGNGPGGGSGGPSSADDCAGGGGAGYLFAGSGGSSSNPALRAEGGPRYGGKTLLPLVGGSGGGGGGACKDGIGGGGGGGGGAILIASSGTISFRNNGSNFPRILAAGGGGVSPRPGSRGGGSGSGGAIRLIANTINGRPILDVSASDSIDSFAGSGSHGYISVEANDLNNFSLRGSVVAISYGRPGIVMPTNLPTLRIASVGGVNAPANPKGSFGGSFPPDPPDISLPTSQTNPVQVSIQATNIQPGNVVRVAVIQESGARTEVNSTPLAGSFANLTATASVNLPNGVSVVTATISLSVQLALGRPLFINGERVDRMEVATSFGRESELTFITQSGRRVRSSEL